MDPRLIFAVISVLIQPGIPSKSIQILMDQYFSEKNQDDSIETKIESLVQKNIENHSFFLINEELELLSRTMKVIIPKSDHNSNQRIAFKNPSARNFIPVSVRQVLLQLLIKHLSDKASQHLDDANTVVSVKKKTLGVDKNILSHKFVSLLYFSFLTLLTLQFIPSADESKTLRSKVLFVINNQLFVFHCFITLLTNTDIQLYIRTFQESK